MTAKCKFRFHRGSLEESLETITEVSSKQELCDIINQHHNLNINTDDIVIKYYAKDSRINGDSYIVTVNGLGVIGFTNANL